MYLIVGLGNPGKKFEATRHNIGFEVIDYIAKEYGIKVNKIKHKALIGEGLMRGNRVILAKPQTYMNLSGESVRDISEYYKIPTENIIIIYDDINLSTGSVRIRAKGSDGGHNGMKSIIYQLASNEFPRLRIGVGAPAHKEHELVDYVLGKFMKSEMPDIIDAIMIAPDAVCTIMNMGVELAGSKYNKTMKNDTDTDKD